MKHLLPVAAALAAAIATFPAHGETYQWKDSSGHTVISDMPPPPTVKVKKTVGGGNQDSETSTPAEKTTAEKNLDFKKRQQEAKEKSDKEAKEQQAATAKRENCERARGNLAALESNLPMATFDEKGNRKAMDTDARQQEIDRTRRIMEESCK